MYSYKYVLYENKKTRMKRKNVKSIKKENMKLGIVRSLYYLPIYQHKVQLLT